MQGICTACEEPCEVVLIDFGIGHYEYWGATGVDIQIEAVSNCCEEPTIDADGKVITVQDVERSNL